METRSPNPRRGATATGRAAVDLTRLPVGSRARYLGARLDRADLDLLESLGLTDACSLRVCQVGDPWVVQVRSTRIGLAGSVARAILVLPEGEP